jgi:ABC-type oligopeptide transport system ATPase subunit
MESPILEARDIRVHFPIRSGLFARSTQSIKAVDGVSLAIHRGETLALVGESGCGKTSLARALMGLYQINSGEIYLSGTSINARMKKSRMTLYRDLQMIFQDPFESLNPRHSVSRILEEPMIIHTNYDLKKRNAEVRRLLDLVGLPSDSASRFPFEFSGGQRQRIGIARAIALNPKVIICDEPVSALDVSIQAQIVNLLLDLQRELSLSYLLIAHGLPLVRHMADRIAVMYQGRIVEEGPARDVYHQPQHPYTQALLAAIPRIPSRSQETSDFPGMSSPKAI